MEVLLDKKNIIRRNLVLKNIFFNKNIHILGSGPSLLTLDTKKIKNDIVFVVNDYYLNEHITGINPNFIILADPLYYQQAKKYTYPLLEHVLKSGLPTNLLLPVDGLSLMISMEHTRKILTPFYFDMNSEIESYNFDIHNPIKPIAQNVINIAIILAMYTGSNNIFLHGVDQNILSMTKEMYEADWNWDHSYIAHSKNRPGLKSYMEEHGHGWSKLQEYISTMGQQFKELKLLADLNGTRVINCSKNSHLKIFEFGGDEFLLGK